MIPYPAIDLLRATPLPLEIHLLPDDHTVVTIAPLDEPGLGFDRALAEPLRQLSVRCLIVDCAAVPMVSSEQLGAAIGAVDGLVGATDAILVYALGDPVREILELLGLGSMVPITPDRHAALGDAGAITAPTDDPALTRLLEIALASPEDPAPLRVAADFLSERGAPLGASLSAVLRHPELRFRHARPAAGSHVSGTPSLVQPLPGGAEAVFG